MSRNNQPVIKDRRYLSTISFRQYLLPKDTSDLKNNWVNKHQINPGVLAAIADQSQIQPPLSFNQKVIKVYKSIGKSIRPDDPVLIFWNILLVLIEIYFILQIGLLFCFTQVFWQDQLNYLLGLQIAFILILIVDILLSPFKAFYDQGLLIKDISLIYKRYVSLELWMDLLALISLIIPLAVGNLEANWIKLLWFLKLYSMSNIFGQLQRITQLNIIHNTIFLTIKLIICAYFYSHFMSIFFYRISLAIYESNYYGPNTPNWVWIYNSWAFYQLAFLTWYQIYAYIMYFGIEVITTIAYGDITAKNPLQCIYIIWALIFQTILWGYLIAEIIRLFINIYAYNFSRRYQHISLNTKLKASLVSDFIFKRVQIHTQEIDRDEQYRNREVQQEILKLLPPDPLYGMLLIIYKNFLYKIGFSFVNNLNYQSLGPATQKSLFLESFMKSIRQERHFAGDVLYLQGEVEDQKPQNHCAYCYTSMSYSQSVVLGVGEHIQIKSESSDSARVKKSQKIRSFQLQRPKLTFGQIQFLNGEQRSHWAICIKNCLIFSVSRKVLQQNYHLLTLEQKEVISKNAQNIKHESCLICGNKHFLKNCPYSFVSASDKIDISKNTRHLVQRALQRTRIKTLSSWRLFTSIRDVKINISKAYKDKLFYDKSAHELFASLELQQKFQDQLEGFNIEQEMFETQVIIDSLYRQQLDELGLSEEQWSCDQVHNFSYYKPASNVDKVSEALQKARQSKKERRKARNF